MKAKTKLFVTLIGMMVLTFGGINLAMAENTPDVETINADAQVIAIKIQKVQQKITDVKEELEGINDGARISKLEAGPHKLDKVSYAVSSSVVVPPEEVSSSSSSCHELINDCTLDMHTDDIPRIRSGDDYLMGSCPSGSSALLCTDFMYGAFDIPGWYQDRSGFYFDGSGFTNTCTLNSQCSTWGVIAILPVDDSTDIQMTYMPRGIAMKTIWSMEYGGLFLVQSKSHMHIQTFGYESIS